MKNERTAKRFEGPSAMVQLMRHLEMPVGQRPKISIESPALDEFNPVEGVVVRNHVLKDPDKLTEHSVFQVADLFKSKSGRPLTIRFVWPPEHADPHGKRTYPPGAITVTV